MLPVCLTVLMFGFMNHCTADGKLQNLNPFLNGATFNPLNTGIDPYLQTKLNGYGSPSRYASFAPYNSNSSPLGNVYAPYSNTYGPYSNTYAPYTNTYSPFGNSFNPYFSGASSIANGNGPYNEGSVIDYPSYLSNYGYDSRFFTPHSLGQEFGAGTQVGYPGMPGSYRIRIIGALHAESTAPGTPGAYASALSLSGHNGQNGGSFAGKKKK